MQKALVLLIFFSFLASVTSISIRRTKSELKPNLKDAGRSQDDSSKEIYNPHPRYQYRYVVHSPQTEDFKGHWEERNGDFIKGAYGFSEPDGTIRIVEYTVTKDRGFEAVVKKIGKSVHPVKG